MDVTKNGKESNIKIISKTLREFQMGYNFVDGQKTSKKELDKLDPNLIESMNVLKGKNALTNMAKTAQMVLLILLLRKINPFEISH
jgi:hypothetical protein